MWQQPFKVQDALQLTTIIKKRKSHNKTLICWGFFVVNNKLPIDFENPLICNVYFVSFIKLLVTFKTKVPLLKMSLLNIVKQMTFLS